MKRRRLTHFVVAAAPVEQAQIVGLSKGDQRRIAAAILNPPAPTKALKKSAKRHRDLFGEG